MGVVFGAAVALVLLFFYGYAVTTAIGLVWEGQSLTPEAIKGFETSFSEPILLIGGLVSALVIAVLAITPPKEDPARNFLAADASTAVVRGSQAVVWCYLAAWFVLGVAAYFYGRIKYPDALPILTSHAKTWFGFAVSAAYAYFGLSQGRGG